MSNDRTAAEYEVREWMGENDVVLKTPAFRALIDLVIAATSAGAAAEPVAVSALANERLEPVISLGYHQSEDGTYRAVMTVSGLTTEQQANGVLDHMEKLFCGEQMEATNG